MVSNGEENKMFKLSDIFYATVCAKDRDPHTQKHWTDKL